MLYNKEYYIKSKSSKLYLGVNNDNKIVIETSFKNNSWMYTKDKKLLHVKSKKVLDMINIKKGSNLFLNDNNKYKISQTWTITILGAIISKTNINEGFCLDIANNLKSDGSLVCCWELKGSQNQLWKFVEKV
jgi:hypothetical protein